MTHLRRCDIASVKCRVSIFMLTTYHGYRYIYNHFRRRCVAIIDMPWSCERGRYLAGDESDYKVGLGSPPLHTRFRKGQSGNPGGRSRKSLPALLRNALNEPALVTDRRPQGRAASSPTAPLWVSKAS